MLQLSQKARSERWTRLMGGNLKELWPKSATNYFQSKIYTYSDNRFTATYFENRYGNVQKVTVSELKSSFYSEFDK
jgi:hypothetical protein